MINTKHTQRNSQCHCLVVLSACLLLTLHAPPTIFSANAAFVSPSRFIRRCPVAPSFLQTPNRHSTRTRLHGSFLKASSFDLERSGGNGDPFNSSGSGSSEEQLGNVQIPSTGVSVNDEIDSSERDRFQTELVPITGMKTIAAQLVTTATKRGSFEAVRYLVSLSQPPVQPKSKKGERKNTNNSQQTSLRVFAMIDIPPYSQELVSKMKTFMGPNSHLAAILVTNRDAIHYDDAPAVYRLRRTDLDLWKQVFPGLQIIAYRLDIPRDCRDSVTQVLDGYGPFALDEAALQESIAVKNNENATNLFIETGKPLTYQEWDHDVAQDILRGRKPLLEEDNDTAATDSTEDYSPSAIRAREEGKRILAIYTPGHSFGSVSYIFPEVSICCSGYTIPVEDTRDEENTGMGTTGPALDCRGYITTSRGGMEKQMESARQLVKTYSDRFDAVFASRGDPLVVGGNEEEKRGALLDIIDQYDRIGKIYEQLGITSSKDDDDESAS